MKNKFNNLTSKEWLPFQKSWFQHTSDQQLYESNISFFTKTGAESPNVTYYGPNKNLASQVCEKRGLNLHPSENSNIESLQYALIDLRAEIDENTKPEEYEIIKKKVVDQAVSLYEKIENRRFLTVFIRNIQQEGFYYPYAWDLAKHLSYIFSIKDEKIACLKGSTRKTTTNFFDPSFETFYCLYFRKDENSGGVYKQPELSYFHNNRQEEIFKAFKNGIPRWFILKPRSRKKKEILHPAKYPENLVEMFIQEFSNEGENVFDPMSGTGSTQLGALRMKRNGYGTELSPFFADIANERCREFNNPTQMQLFSEEKIQDYKILVKDARSIGTSDFPPIDYVLTSPPYWDMLNMKGAENQAKRKEKGLQTNYSGDREDLGNIEDYKKFINELTKIYFNIANLLKEGNYMTIVVKNIKKKGQNYPFAWDLAHALQKKLILLPEVFWLQDDISIAPYGYGNTWVSNTFHQYCLTFQKPTE